MPDVAVTGWFMVGRLGEVAVWIMVVSCRERHSGGKDRGEKNKSDDSVCSF